MVDYQEHFEGIARISRWAWSVSWLFSLGCLIAVGTMWVRVYTAPPAPAPADTVVTTPEEVKRFRASPMALTRFHGLLTFKPQHLLSF